MDLRPCSLLLLWTLVVALTLLAKEVLAQRIYTNTWAVLVPAGPQEADRLARKHGFLNLGPVSPPLPSPCRSHVLCWLCHGLGWHRARPWSWLGGCSFWQQCRCIPACSLQPPSICCLTQGRSLVLSWMVLGHPPPASWSGGTAWHGTLCGLEGERPFPA